jgi:hypothetical protein
MILIHNMTPTPTQRALQRRLCASLRATIFAIANALLPLARAIERQTDKPWQQRASLSARLFAIIQEILALTTRIRPATIAQNPVFPARTPRRPSTRTATAPPGPTLPKNPLSARQLAQRLESLLRKLQELAAEARAFIPKRLHNLTARARHIAGCDALPIPHPTRLHAWERAG